MRATHIVRAKKTVSVHLCISLHFSKSRELELIVSREFDTHTKSVVEGPMAGRDPVAKEVLLLAGYYVYSKVFEPVVGCFVPQ